MRGVLPCEQNFIPAATGLPSSSQHKLITHGASVDYLDTGPKHQAALADTPVLPFTSLHEAVLQCLGALTPSVPG